MITRRSLFAGAASLGLSAALGTPPVCAAARRAPLCDPFQLGIASGEPASDGVVLWTRLAMDPVALDGLGGMPDRAVPVQWELARDEGFRRVVRRGGSVAVELVTTSVTSAGDGLDEYPDTQNLLAENPHVKFFNGRRGYVRTRITRQEMKVDFRSLSRVTEPYAPAYTSGSFVIEPGRPQLNPA